MTSSRLPGKVLRQVAGREVLAHQIDRVRRATRVDRICIATTTNDDDDPVAELAEREAVAVFRGSESDVLDRVLRAAELVGADVTVRLTGDCPLTDPELVDSVIDRFETADPAVDLATNSVPRTWPIGLDVEVVSADALRIAATQATDSYDREHVTPFFYSNRDRFRIAECRAPRDLSGYRWTLDEVADLELIESILSELLPRNPRFGWRDVIALLEAHPDWRSINAHIRQKSRRYEDATREGTDGRRYGD